VTFGDWGRYHAATEGRPPRPTLLRAMQAFAREGGGPGLLALDLGCGIGRDALPLLRAGWRVLALDQEVPALEALARRAALDGLAGLEVVAASFATMRLPPADLVNASFSLFACEPAAFPAAWAKIRAAMKPGGRFAGQLLGPRDSWSVREGCTVLERAAVDRLLDGLEVERVEEEETDSVTPQGEAKHWHIWHVNARRAPS
jgi:SAM-dependent methyltransferase